MKKLVNNLRGFFTSSYLGSLSLTTVTNILLAGLGLVGGILSARLLGPSGRGELAAIQTFPTILASLAMLGIPDALVYFSARQPERAGKMLTTAILMALFFCMPFVLVGLFLVPIVLASQTPDVIQGARNYLWLLPINATAGMLVNPLRGTNKFPAWNLARTFPTILWIIVLIAVFLAGITSTILITNWYLVGLAFLLIPTSLLVFKEISGSYRPSKEYLAPFARYGIPSALSTIPFWLNSRLDQIIMASLFEPRLLGLYVVAFSWSNAITPLTSVLPSVMLPYIARIHGDEQQIQTLALNTRVGGTISLFLSVTIALLAPIFIPILFGDEFTPVVPISVILSLATGFLAMNQILEAGALSLGKPRMVLAGESLGLMITVVMLFFLLKPYELVGAAVTSLVSYAFVTIFLITLILKVTLIPPAELLFPKRSEIVFLWSLIRKRVLRDSS